MGNLPFNGEYSLPKRNRFEQTVVLVPFYRAEKMHLQKHLDFINKLGYRSVVFDLEKESRSIGVINQLISSQQKIGLKSVWADQVEAVLNAIPGKKIVYAFSNPSASAIEAIARRRAVDIDGLICDSDPSGHLFQSMMSYFTEEEPVSFWPKKLIASLATTLIWSPDFLSTIQSDLVKLPAGFKIPSIRGWKDPLITPGLIDRVFESSLNIDWRKLSLPQAAHLNGLRDYPNEYENGVINFLNEISRELSLEAQ